MYPFIIIVPYYSGYKISHVSQACYPSLYTWTYYKYTVHEKSACLNIHTYLACDCTGLPPPFSLS